MKAYKPNTPYNVPFFLIEPEAGKKVKGVKRVTYKKKEKPFFCSFKTFGGTEKVINDVIVREDTATIETWYDPSIKANCRIEVEGVIYEILGTPENIDMRNQYLVFKVRAVRGDV